LEIALTDLEALAARVNALEQTLGVVTMLAMRQLPPAKRPQLAEAIGEMARTAEQQLDRATATLLTQLHGAAAMAALK
jgi:hypothetical protein